jgi:hypothetical protein
MTNQELESFQLDWGMAEADLPAFKALLDQNTPLSEKNDISPFFQKRPHLIGVAATLFSPVEIVDRIRHEFSLFAHFRADWAAGDSKNSRYLFLEFEDARPNSVFEDGKYHHAWGQRLEQGFSQIVDWFWSLDLYRETPDYKRNFGDRSPEFLGLLVIGRRSYLAVQRDLENRLRWRARHLSVHGATVRCITFDDFYDALESRLIQRRSSMDANKADDSNAS